MAFATKKDMPNAAVDASSSLIYSSAKYVMTARKATVSPFVS